MALRRAYQPTAGRGNFRAGKFDIGSEGNTPDEVAVEMDQLPCLDTKAGESAPINSYRIGLNCGKCSHKNRVLCNTAIIVIVIRSALVVRTTGCNRRQNWAMSRAVGANYDSI